MIFDTHVHTKFSTDSRMTIQTVLEKIYKLNIGVIITEHMDYAYPEPQAFIFDAEAYFQEYGSLRSDMLLLGVEVGMRNDCLADNSLLVGSMPFDYVIGSIHVIDNIDIYDEKFYRNSAKQDVYERYFDSMLACLNKYDFIDSLGHIDYITRYARFEDAELYYHEFAERLDQVLKTVIAKNKALEINTRRLGSRQAVDNLITLYKRYHELGGRLVTIGSDAHKPEDIGKHFKEAFEIAEMCRLHPVYFKNRQVQYMKS